MLNNYLMAFIYILPIRVRFSFDHPMYYNKTLFLIHLVEYYTLNDKKYKNQSHLLLSLQPLMSYNIMK